MSLIKIPGLATWLIPAAALVGSLGCDPRSVESTPEAAREPIASATAQAAPIADAPATNTADANTADAPKEAPESSPEIEPKLDPALAERLRIKRLVVATSVDQREPQGAADSFDLDGLERVYAFVEVENPSRAASEVIVTFEPPAGAKASPTGHVRLSVGAAPRWRTWAYTRGINHPGEWTAVVATPTGKELARHSFLITEA
jgi:hypothetical protein